MDPFESLSKTGVVTIDCSGNPEPLTLHVIVELLSQSHGSTRLDDVTVTPVMVNGRIAVRIEVSDRFRHVPENEAVYLDLQ